MSPQPDLTPETRAILFNCCTNNEEPDWSQFDGFEIHPCRTERLPTAKLVLGLARPGQSDDEYVEDYTAQCEPEDAEFWGVYGHLKEGGIDAITDCNSEELAEWVVAFLAQRSGLPWQ